MSHNVRVVSSSVNGVAAQAVAVSHALNSEALRDDIGLDSASARQVANSVNDLVQSRSIWADCSNAVALLDPITGLAVRLSHVSIDGSIALIPDECLEQSDDGAVVYIPAPVPATSVEATPLPHRHALAAVTYSRWVREISNSTPITFNASVSKRGAISVRFEAYRHTTTVGEYRASNSNPRFVHADLALDLRIGNASLP